MSSLRLDMRAERLPSIGEALTNFGSPLYKYSINVRARMRGAKGAKVTPVHNALSLQNIFFFTIYIFFVSAHITIS